VDPAVAEAVSAAGEARNARTQINADWVLQRLVAEVEADVADIYNDNGGLKPMNEWPLIWRKGLVAGLESETIRSGDKGTGQWRGNRQDIREGEDDEETYVVKVKLSDRLKRLELIGKHIAVQAFKERVQVEVHESLGERLDRAKKNGARRQAEREAAVASNPNNRSKP
jgi:phage terminase small subunit